VRKELHEIEGKLATELAKPAENGETGDAELQGLVARENWLAAQLELYGDPPAPTMRPFETWGPPAPPDESEVPLPDETNEKKA
jgi:hypothetical protein